MKSEPSASSEPVNGRPSRRIARNSWPRGQSKRLKSSKRANSGRLSSATMKASESHIVMALATPVPTAPSAGAPRWPNMNTQLSSTLHGSAAIVMSMIGRVRPSPSLVYVNAWLANIAGTPQLIACT
jgi:hypothetical protein